MNCKLCRIEINNLSVNMDKEFQLKNINLHIHCGEISVLIGPNGAGKTTLIRALLRQLPFSGELRHIDSHNKDFGRLKIGYVPQSLGFDKSIPMTVEDFLAACLSKRAVFTGKSRALKEEISKMLENVGAERLEKRQLGKLSGGELQRVLLALALRPTPDLLILDEPISGVDKNGQIQFFKTILEIREKSHMAILMVLHDHEIIRRFADRVILIDKTKLKEGTPDEVYSSEEFYEAFPLEGRVRL